MRDAKQGKLVEIDDDEEELIALDADALQADDDDLTALDPALANQSHNLIEQFALSDAPISSLYTSNNALFTHTTTSHSLSRNPWSHTLLSGVDRYRN